MNSLGCVYYNSNPANGRSAFTGAVLGRDGLSFQCSLAAFVAWEANVHKCKIRSDLYCWLLREFFPDNPDEGRFKYDTGILNSLSASTDHSVVRLCWALPDRGDYRAWLELSGSPHKGFEAISYDPVHQLAMGVSGYLSRVHVSGEYVALTLYEALCGSFGSGDFWPGPKLYR